MSLTLKLAALRFQARTLSVKHFLYRLWRNAVFSRTDVPQFGTVIQINPTQDSSFIVQLFYAISQEILAWRAGLATSLLSNPGFRDSIEVLHPAVKLGRDGTPSKNKILPHSRVRASRRCKLWEGKHAVFTSCLFLLGTPVSYPELLSFRVYFHTSDVCILQH